MKIRINLFVGLIITTVLIIKYTPHSFISILLYLLMAIAINKLIVKTTMQDVFYNFVFYIFFAVLIYAIQYYSFPKTIGLTTGRLVLGAGTDDVYFYGQAALEFPNDFPFRGQQGGDFFSLDGYSKILRLIAIFFGLFFTVTPLDLIAFNVLVLTFLPIYTSRVYELAYPESINSKKTNCLVRICPFIIGGSCILLRDGIIAVFFMISLYYFFKKDIIKSLIPIGFITFLRFGTAVFIIITYSIILFVGVLKKSGKKKILFTFYFFALLLIISFINYANIRNYIFSKMGGETIVRNFLAEKQINNASKIGTGTIYYSITSLPLIIRIFAASTVMLIAPLFEPKLVVMSDIFIIKNFLVDVCYPIYFCISFPWFCSGIIYSIKRKKNNDLLEIYVILLILISVISMQSRHKIMIMPLYYIICAIGNEHSSNKLNYLIFVMILIFAEIFSSLI